MRDGIPNPMRRQRSPTYTTSGADSAAKCSGCGKGLGFVEGGTVIGGLCNKCSGVPVGDDPWGSTIAGERIRTNLNGG